MTRALITLDSIDLTLGRTRLLEKAFLSVAERDRICLVGRNGSGKSTLLKIAAGIVEPDAGNRFVHPAARVAYLAQEADFGGAETVRGYVERQLAPTDDGGGIGRLLAELGLEPDWEPQRLSGGEARRLAIAGVIAADPDVLLLDEPTNHLDIPAIEWLEKRLASLRAGIVLISHDRRLLERVSRATVWLDRGQTRT
ncbi:MAG: ATP-binding cassette domain-containing protein, partial [Hyphomicrobiales bacterium]|nr:ATP-binding cassette domain-containing protein [Hyphomicrobiales bacterium]